MSCFFQWSTTRRSGSYGPSAHHFLSPIEHQAFLGISAPAIESLPRQQVSPLCCPRVGNSHFACLKVRHREHHASDKPRSPQRLATDTGVPSARLSWWATGMPRRVWIASNRKLSIIRGQVAQSVPGLRIWVKVPAKFQRQFNRHFDRRSSLAYHVRPVAGAQPNKLATVQTGSFR